MQEKRMQHTKRWGSWLNLLILLVGLVVIVCARVTGPLEEFAEEAAYIDQPPLETVAPVLMAIPTTSPMTTQLQPLWATDVSVNTPASLAEAETELTMNNRYAVFSLTLEDVKTLAAIVSLEAVDAARYGKSIFPKDVAYFSATSENSRVWRTIGPHVFCYQYVWG